MWAEKIIESFNVGPKIWIDAINVVPVLRMKAGPCNYKRGPLVCHEDNIELSCYIKDEGRPLEIDIQVLVSNHLKLQYKIQEQLDYALTRWAKRKYKRLKSSLRKARNWLRRIRQKEPDLFVHWQLGI